MLWPRPERLWVCAVLGVSTERWPAFGKTLLSVGAMQWIQLLAIAEARPEAESQLSFTCVWKPFRLASFRSSGEVVDDSGHFIGL